MPGKVNPVIPEVVNQVAFNIIGNDVTITLAAEAGQLELNAFEPIIFYNLFHSIENLGFAVQTLVDNCIVESPQTRNIAGSLWKTASAL
jgi:aspartate ammonia-lyase